MIESISRHRPIALLAAVVFAQVLLLAYQIKRAHDVRLIRYWSVQATTPVESGGTWFFARIGGIWNGYIGLRNARIQDAQLQEEVGRLRLRNSELENQAAEAQRLQVLLNFRDAHPEAQMIAAQVIGASADPSSHTLFLNRGDQDHVRRNMAVITPDGIVGKTVEVFPTTSQVMLINDKDMGVGALFSDTRTHGVVKGTGDPRPRMDYVVNDEKVSPGEVILTSGDDRIFPKGLLIGTVASAKDGNPFQNIQVQPATRLDRLEDVIILVTQQELAPKKPDEPFGVSPAPPPSPVAAAPVLTPPATQTRVPSDAGAKTAPKSAAPNSSKSGPAN
jgi:rod shape-determining protein MreC